MYIQYNTEAHSYNHFCNGKAIKYYTFQEFVFVASGTQHVMHKHHTVMCGLPSKTIFFHMSHKLYSFQEKVMEHKMCFSLYTIV
jgi:hypothetical protein